MVPLLGAQLAAYPKSLPPQFIWNVTSSSRHRHYFVFNLGKTYRMDVGRSQDAVTDNVTLTRYSTYAL